MRRYSTLLAGVCALAVATAAQAAPDVSVAVLGIEPVDVPESLAQQLTDALRQRAASTGGIRMVQGKDLIEVKMVFGCDGELPACMAQAGKTLGAEKLLYGTVKKGPSKTTVTVALKLLDVKTAVVEKFVNDTVQKREVAGSNVNASAGRWFGQLLEIEAKPTLTVTSDPSGASVTVDGQSSGRTPLTLRDLTAGPHTVVVSMAGRQSVTRTVDLRAGGSHDVVATLEAEPPVVAQKPREIPPEPSPLIPPPTQKPVRATEAHPGRTAKIIAGVLVGGALVTAGVAIYTWRHYSDDLANQAHMDLESLKPPMATMEEKAFFDNPGCNNVPGSIQTANPTGVAKYKNDCNAGNDYANATTGLWVATGALAAAGVVAFVIGDRQAAKAKERRLGVLRQSLRVAPVFTTKGGGVTAAFEF